MITIYLYEVFVERRLLKCEDIFTLFSATGDILHISYEDSAYPDRPALKLEAILVADESVILHYT